jgi:glyoxalase superfamily protein
MHRILLRTVVIDVPSDVNDLARDFWTTALRSDTRHATKHPEYHVLENSAAAGPVLVQDVGTTPARVHLDIESSDIEAEVARLVAAGASEVGRHSDWVVLRDPAGLLFCVVPGGGDDFDAQSVEVE